MVMLTDLADVLRDAGLTVVELDDWKTRTRPASAGAFTPQGNLWHHTGSPAGGRDYAEWMALEGRADLPPPLCQVAVDRNGTCHVSAAGRSNHAGAAKASGPCPAGDGNTLYIGWECMNSGTEGWTPEQRAAMVTAGAATSRAYGWTAAHNRAHKETSSTGKWDPGALDMDDFRADIAKAMKRGRGTTLLGINAAWHLPPDKRRALIHEASEHGSVIAGVEGKWLKAARVLGDEWDVLQGEGAGRSGCFLAFDKSSSIEHSEPRWTIGTDNKMAGRQSATMETRYILEVDAKLEAQWRTVMTAHFPPKRYFWLYARMLRNLRKRMSEARYPVLVFADWNRYAAAVAAGTGLNIRHREVVGWAFSPGQSVSPPRRVDVGGDHPGIAITLRSKP